MRVAPGPLDPVGVSAAEYEPSPREERSDTRRLCPWVPSPLEIADHAVRLAGISTEDVVIDLGCGTGEVLPASRAPIILRHAAAPSIHGLVSIAMVIG